MSDGSRSREGLGEAQANSELYIAVRQRHINADHISIDHHLFSFDSAPIFYSESMGILSSNHSCWIWISYTPP